MVPISSLFDWLKFLSVLYDGFTVASWLVHAALNRAVRARALAGGIAFCSGQYALPCHSASLHSGVQMGTCEFNAGDNPAMD